MHPRAIHHDPELYDCPEDFVPERYEDNPLGLKPDIREVSDGIRQTYGFGAGRRICPGSHLAENSLVGNECSHSIPFLQNYFIL